MKLQSTRPTISVNRITVSLMACLIFMLGAWSLAGTASASGGNEYETLRLKYKFMLTGGNAFNPSDPDISVKIAAIDAAAGANWSQMDTAPSRTSLWSDLTSTSQSHVIAENYIRLKSMALAYSTHGSALEGDAALLSDTIGGLDWMYANRYNTTVTPYDNWFSWEIAIPRELNQIVVLLYDELSPAQMANYMSAVERFSPDPTVCTTSTGGYQEATGANRANKAAVVAVRGLIVESAAKLELARDALSQPLTYVTEGDGFHADGSFIQHGNKAYTGAYGLDLIAFLSDILYVTQGSTWEVTDPNIAHVYEWIYKSFEPLFYKGAFMDMTRGRIIAIESAEDHVTGHGLIRTLAAMTQFAPPVDAANYKSMIKAWVAQDTYLDFYANPDTSLFELNAAQAIAADTTIAARPLPAGVFPYNAMSRTSFYGDGFAFGISMTSNRIKNYEVINGNNLKGWYTGYGMTYLYNSDLDQYSDNYWPSVNMYRLAGTTVDTKAKADTEDYNLFSSRNWVGGTKLGPFGTTGQELNDVSTNLEAKKSWFMFDDEIVALGAGISNSSQSGNGWDGKPRTVETIVENRKLNASGSNALTVDGVAKSTALPWTEAMGGVSWAHLAGSSAGADIGYYFPGGAQLKGLREARTGSWQSMDASGTPAPHTRSYMALWLDHGANPTNATYSYALLPGKTSTQVAGYAADPDYTVLANSPAVQAVKEEGLGVVGANFWTDAYTTVTADGENYLTSNKKAAVMVKESAGEITVSAADPTQANTGTITIIVHRSASSIVSADPGITVQQLSPSIIFTVNVNQAKGKTFQASFSQQERETAPVLYQASTGFSSTQGAGGWSYQTWNGSVYADMIWDAAGGRWQGAEPYSLVMMNSQHPDNTLDSVRVWTAPVAGEATIIGNVAKAASGGDGVVATILHNAVSVFNRTIGGTDRVGHDVFATVTVAAGDRLYFRVNRNATRSSDSTSWDPLILFAPSSAAAVYEA